MYWVWLTREFVRDAGRGGKGNLPLEGAPKIVKTEPWDGKDGEVIEEDEFSLEELMGEDSTSKDELWIDEKKNVVVIKMWFRQEKILDSLINLWCQSFLM